MNQLATMLNREPLRTLLGFFFFPCIFAATSLHRRLPLSPPPPPPPDRLCLRPPNPHHSRRLEIRALDAAQPFDLESRFSDRIQKSSKLKIAIIGFGNFGQFLAKTLIRQGHTILAYSRSDYSDVAASLGASFFSDADDLCEEHPEVVTLIFCQLIGLFTFFE